MVPWYEAAILQSLQDQPTTLTIFTAQEVAGRFLPHQVHTQGRKERRAAIHALKHLADMGVLYLREMHGEVWYLNDECPCERARQHNETLDVFEQGKPTESCEHMRDGLRLYVDTTGEEGEERHHVAVRP
jgi:hypothetical protein